MTYTPRWPKRKLTELEGERILWHALGHLQKNQITYWEDFLACERAMATIKDSLDSLGMKRVYAYRNSVTGQVSNVSPNDRLA